MKIKDVVAAVQGTVLCGQIEEDSTVDFCFASDLMSDVLTIQRSDFMLLTGLANLQSIRTAEMSDLKYVLYVRGKEVTEEMRELASENGMVVISTPFSMFKTSGILYAAGMQGVY